MKNKYTLIIKNETFNQTYGEFSLQNYCDVRVREFRTALYNCRIRRSGNQLKTFFQKATPAQKMRRNMPSMCC